jgi:hypothetical protein
VRRRGGGIVIEPLAIVVGTEVVVPDLADAAHAVHPVGWGDDGDPLQVAVDRAIGVLAEVPHRGLRHLPPGFGDRLRAVGDELRRVGLGKAAEAVGAFREARPDVAVERWVDAYLRLTVTAELV